MKLPRYIKRAAPLIVLGVFVLLAALALNNPPKLEYENNRDGGVVAVDVLALRPVRYQVMLQSYGIVQPR